METTGAFFFPTGLLTVLQRSRRRVSVKTTASFAKKGSLEKYVGERRKGLTDHFKESNVMIKSDGGPPRWFSSLECGSRSHDSPLLFLPGIDGVGLGLIMHHHMLGKFCQLSFMWSQGDLVLNYGVLYFIFCHQWQEDGVDLIDRPNYEPCDTFHFKRCGACEGSWRNSFGRTCCDYWQSVLLVFELLSRTGMFGGVPVSAINFYKLLSSKSHILLYPGSIREALHRKNISYFWPELSEFVRMAARLGAKLIPFGAVGEDDFPEAEVERSIALLKDKREKDPYRNILAQLVCQATHGLTSEIPTFEI